MITQRMMIDAIVMRLRGQKDGVNPGIFSEPWAGYYRAIDAAPDGQGLAALSPIAKPEHIAMLLQHEPQNTCYPSLEEQQSEINPITWYWQDWVVNGKINLIGAYPGIGKTTVNVELARRQIHEKAFPDGQPVHDPGKPILYIDAEGYKEGVLQRVNNLQIDKRRFFLWTPGVEDLMLDFSLPQVQDELVERIYKIKPACIFADSLSFFLVEGDKDLKEVRRVLGFFNKVASEFNLPVIMNHHPRKEPQAFLPEQKNKRLKLDDFRGSSLIGAVSRVVIALSSVQTTEDENEDGPRVMYQVKNNEGRKLEIGFEFMPLIGGGVGIKWGEAPKPYKKPDEIDACEAWLHSLLEEEGDLQPKEISKLGKEQGFSEATIWRARKRSAQIQDTRKSKHDKENSWHYVKSQVEPAYMAENG